MFNRLWSAVFAAVVFAAIHLMACQPPYREYSPGAPSVSEEPVNGLPSKAGYLAEPEHSASKCPPPVCESSPYEVCLVRDCALHACQLAAVAPEVGWRCGDNYCGIDDGYKHAHCPTIAGIVTEPKVCGGPLPSMDACMVFGGPLVGETRTALCCTPDGSPLPVDCTADADCQAWDECQFAYCASGRCVVQFYNDLDPCGGGSYCYDGICQPVVE